MSPAKRNRSAKCPICVKPARVEHAPFCSARCGQVDLGRWLGGHYAIPSRGPAEYEDGVPRPGNDADDDSAVGAADDDAENVAGAG